MAKATFDKSRTLQLFARIGETGVPKVLTFVNDDGTDHAIASYDFELQVYSRPNSPAALFTLTIGSGLTVQNTNELLIEITAAQAARDVDTYFWKLYSDTEDHTWLNGPFYFHDGEFDGVTETDTITITDNGTAVEITVSQAVSSATQSEVNTGTSTTTYVSPSTFANSSQLAAKQATLVSGTNIKTINGSSVLGSGDLTVSGGGVSGLTATRVPYAQDATTLVDSQYFSWDDPNAALTVRSQRILDKGTNGAKGIFIGYNTGNTTSITTPDGFNVGFGYSVLPALTNAANSYDASYNTAVGYEAGLSATSGASNTLIGYRAGRAITTGLGNTAVGKDCLRSVATSGSNNTAVGYLCLDQMTGSENTGVGSSCLSGTGTGTRNVGVGYICLTSVTNGSNNVGVGSEVFEFITTQGNNTGVGFWAGVFNKGSNNVAIGAYAMGQATLNSTNDASYNTIVGPSAGSFIAQGDYNTWIGYDTGTAGTGEVYSNTIAIGKAAKVTETNSCVIGGTADANRNNYGFGGEGYGSGRGVLYIKNATTNSSAAGTNGIIIHSKDSSGGSANATLALYLEEAPEATASFTQSHRLKVWINGTEYYLSLDAV